MKKIIGINFLVMMMFILSACGSSDTGAAPVSSSQSETIEESQSDLEESPSFAVILKQLNTDYWRIVMAGAEQAAEKYGVEVQFLGPVAETQYEEQIRMIEDQITRNVDGLLVAPNQPDATIPVFNSADDAGIPVFLLDTDANFDSKVSFIGTGNYQAGVLGGEYYKDLLNDGDKVAILRGTMGNLTHDERESGFKEGLENISIEYIVQDTECDRSKSVNVMENVLTANPDLTAVFTTCDETALGAAIALETADRTDIPLMGFDGTPNGLEALKQGKFVAEVAQDPFMIGYLGIETAFKHYKGEEVEERIDSGAFVVTQETVESEIQKIEDYLSGLSFTEY